MKKLVREQNLTPRFEIDSVAELAKRLGEPIPRG